MSNNTEEQITQNVLDSMAQTPSPRLKQVMSSLVSHLHAFIREVELTQEEWALAIQFLTRTGQMCDDKRQEFILLSDISGTTMLVDAINHRSPDGATESTMFGPFYREGAPELPTGATISQDDRGEPVVVTGQVLATDGTPIPGALLDICLGSVVGPHPYPTMVRDFQSVIGVEARRQILREEGKLPKGVVACVGGGSNSIGIFYSFLNDLEVNLYGVEAGGHDMSPGKHAAPLVAGREGVLHGMMTYVLQNAEGQIETTQSISAGLDYPAVGPEHSYLMSVGRTKYVTQTDSEALDAFKQLSQLEGIMPALEPAHAISYATTLAKTLEIEDSIIVNLSGRGDKDVDTIARQFPQ